jgi:hypothetical protein
MSKKLSEEIKLQKVGDHVYRITEADYRRIQALEKENENAKTRSQLLVDDLDLTTKQRDNFREQLQKLKEDVLKYLESELSREHNRLFYIELDELLKQ